MEDLTSKIIKVLNDEGIKPNQIESVLLRVAEEIKFRLWEKINVSPSLLYNLKDTIWYNLEHIPLGGEPKGLTDLKYLGERFPILAYQLDSGFVSSELIPSLLNELGEILQKWSNDWMSVQLFTKSQDGWNGGKNDPSPVVIYEPNESPSKYGYKPYSPKSLIIDSKGEPISSPQLEVVHCIVESKLGTYGKEPLMRQLLERMIDICKKAIEKEKGIAFEFIEYDYK